ncbi:hypothetical protein D3C77_609420 [compost metagenome]
MRLDEFGDFVFLVAPAINIEIPFDGVRRIFINDAIFYVHKFSVGGDSQLGEFFPF